MYPKEARPLNFNISSTKSIKAIQQPDTQTQSELNVAKPYMNYVKKLKQTPTL